MIDLIRYWFALLFLVFWPGAFTFWFVIHPFSRFWRRLGPTIAYLAGAVAAFAVAGLMVSQRHWLMAVEFGAHNVLMVSGAVLIIAAQILDLWVRRYLSMPILLGLPQLQKDAGKGKLLTEGPFKLVRHPRYSVLMLGLFGITLFTNYLALYVLAGVMLPLINLLAKLEERELIDRFGEAYVAYATKTPRFIPKFG